MTTTEKHPTPVLRTGHLYVAGDRLICYKMRCAGQSALYTGVTIHGAPVRPITGRDVIEYASVRPGRPVNVRVREPESRVLDARRAPS